MPATVTRILVEAGQQVARGDTLVLLEAMKMEMPIKAPHRRPVSGVRCRAGELVQPGEPLVELEPWQRDDSNVGLQREGGWDKEQRTRHKSNEPGTTERNMDHGTWNRRRSLGDLHLRACAFSSAACSTG